MRARFLTVGGMAAVAWGIVCAALLVLVAMWLDLLWELSPQLRIYSLGASLVSLAVVLASGLALAWRRGSPRSVAKQMDRATRSGGEVLSGLELSASYDGSELRHGLCVLAVERAARRAGETRGSAVAPMKPVGRGLTAVTATAVAIGFLCLGMPKLAHTQWLRFSDPHGDHPPYTAIEFTIEPGDTRLVYGEGLDIFADLEGPAVERAELVIISLTSGQEESLPMFQQSGQRWRGALARVTDPSHYYVRVGRARSPRYRIDVITVPRIKDVRFRIVPPAYTRAAAYEGQLPPDGLVGLAGTEVEVHVGSNRPLSAGRLTLVIGEERQTIELKPIPGNAAEVTGRFFIEAPGKFELRVVDVDDTVSRESFTGTITLLRDDRPFIRMTQPRTRSLATPSAIIPVELIAEDDYGISRVELYRSLNGSRPIPAANFPPEDPRRHTTDAMLPFSAYGLEPGDEIRLFARVEDNDPAGTKGSETPIATITVISEEEFQRMQRMRLGLQELLSKYRQAKRRMESIAQQIKELREQLDATNDEAVADEIREKLDELAQRLQEEIEGLEQFRKQDLPYDLDRQLSEHLDSVQQQLEDLLNQTEELSSRPELSQRELAEALEKMLDQLKGEQEEFDENVMGPLDYLDSIFPLIEDQAKFIALVLRQRSLADRCAALQGVTGDNPELKARMRDLQEEQEAIRIDLLDLLDDIEDHALQLPDLELIQTNPAEDFIAIFDEQIESKQQEHVKSGRGLAQERRAGPLQAHVNFQPIPNVLRDTALEFVDAVRGSGAIEAMAEAELNLSEFSGDEAYAKATEAAEILEQFVQLSNSMMGMACQNCQMRFQPSVGDMGNTIEQLLAGAGMNPGAGMGPGGGYSAQRNTLSNMGLYGSTTYRSGPPRTGGGAGDAPGADGRYSNDPTHSADNEFGSSVPLRARGSSGAQVPWQYRQRVDAYFRRLAEELDEVR